MARKSILFVYPHPDDESFLTGGTIARYAHSGDADVYLHTLTRGESSRNAALLGITPDEIADLREKEVRDASRILGIREVVQGRFPDGGLRDLDPRLLERDIGRVMSGIDPDLVVTFDVQGSSVHPDHITVHHVVKRVFLSLRDTSSRPKRLAFCGLPTDRTAHWPRKLYGFPSNRIHAVIDVRQWESVERAAVAAHRSVRRDVEDHNYDEWMFWAEEYFSFFAERFSPPLDDLLAYLES
ncbi:MAG: PIG-L family deacetylase [Ignavibacteriae bacterium]|nr:PIG-L family deacetylase [Ignavibacteriota bacterium]